MSRKRKWIAAAAGTAALALAGLFIAGMMLSRRFEPYIRQQAELYLRDRFHADVQIGALHVQMPHLSPLRMLFTRGAGVMASADGEEVSLRRRIAPVHRRSSPFTSSSA